MCESNRQLRWGGEESHSSRVCPASSRSIIDGAESRRGEPRARFLLLSSPPARRVQSITAHLPRPSARSSLDRPKIVPDSLRHRYADPALTGFSAISVF
jgi:hypothetical protein